MLLLDATPLLRTSAGVHAADRTEHDYPDQKSQVFSTAEDNQTAVTIPRVFRANAKWRRTISCLAGSISSGSRAHRAVPQIDVTFDIDANGIVNVSAKDKATNREQPDRIRPRRLSEAISIEW